MNRRDFLTTSASVMVGTALSGCASFGGSSGVPGDGDFLGVDATDLATLIRRGDVTPSELLEWSILRAEAVNPKLNALVIEHFDHARDRAAKGRLPKGPFRGVPFLLKDLGITLEGTVTSHGSRFFKGAVATGTSTLVERYEAAGLVIFGKTASPEFGSSSSTESLAWGETHNPWQTEYSSGGSSGGSAALVAAGVVPIAHASDGGGSIRIPASCCGLFGLKPTRGLTPTGPNFFDKNAGLSINHAVSRTVRDSAALLDATAGPAPFDPYLAPAPERAYLDEVGRDPGSLLIGIQRRATLPTETHPDCLRALDETAHLCESLGHRLEEIEPPPLPGAELWYTFGVMRGTSIAMLVQARERELGRKATPDDLEPQNWSEYQRALGYSAIDHETQRQLVYRWARDVVAHQSRFAAVLSPTLAGPPPKLGVLDPAHPDETFANAAMSMTGFTMAYNLSGQPAMSVPLDVNEGGLPIGSMFAGRLGGEGVLLRLAAQLEEAKPWRARWPALV
ncbi:MAG: amidase [bacterium]|nr:amidase [Deltaproteobacteria bacterium]MCP4905948.1 amidase [bacterium]